MNKFLQLLVIAAGTAFLAGCESTSQTGSQPPAAATKSPYSSWTTAQLQSKRTQLMLASAQPDLQVDPVNGGTSNNWGAQGINAELRQVNAELLRRDPSGKLLTPSKP